MIIFDSQVTEYILNELIKLFSETTAMNPQFHVQIPRANSNKCHVVVSVTQYYDTRPPEEKSGRKKPLVAIGFAVYEVPHSMPRLTPHFVADQVNIHSIL